MPSTWFLISVTIFSFLFLLTMLFLIFSFQFLLCNFNDFKHINSLISSIQSSWSYSPAVFLYLLILTHDRLFPYMFILLYNELILVQFCHLNPGSHNVGYVPPE